MSQREAFTLYSLGSGGHGTVLSGGGTAVGKAEHRAQVSLSRTERMLGPQPRTPSPVLGEGRHGPSPLRGQPPGGRSLSEMLGVTLATGHRQRLSRKRGRAWRCLGG